MAVVNCAGPAAAAIARLAAISLPLVQVPGLVALAPANGVSVNAIVMAPGSIAAPPSAAP